MTFLEKKITIPVSSPDFYQRIDDINRERAVWANKVAKDIFLARQRKDYAYADKLKGDMQEEGVTVMDLPTMTDFYL